MMKKILLLVLTFIVSVSLFAQTDTLVLVNNDVIIGEIKSLDRGVLTFETDYSDSDFKIECKRSEKYSKLYNDFFYGSSYERLSAYRS